MRFNPVQKTNWFAFGRNIVIPSPGVVACRVQTKHAVREQIPNMVIEKQPAVQALFPQCSLNFFESHFDSSAFSLDIGLTRQRTSVFRFATPALSLSSTTVNCKTSSNQSWLDPSRC